MIIYYAHCVALYNTPQEKRDIQLMDLLFPTSTLINPNSPSVEARCTAIRDEIARNHEEFLRDAGAEIMDRVFMNLAQTCDLLVFRALPDGTIPAGVYKEITWAEEANVPILELPSALKRRELTLPQTRQYLAEVGQR